MILRFGKQCFVALLAWFACCSVAQAGIIYDTDVNGKLTGASGFYIDFVPLRVDFVVGSFNEIYSPSSKFSIAQVYLPHAFIVLTEQVFVGQYSPEKVDSPACYSIGICNFSIPEGLVNSPDYGLIWVGQTLSLSSNGAGVSYNEGGVDWTYSFAVFSKDANVPEPAPVILFLLSAGGLIARRQFKKIN